MISVTILLVGIDKSCKIISEVKDLENIISMLRYMAELLENYLNSIPILFEEISQKPYYSKIDFIKTALINLNENKPFENSFKDAVKNSKMTINDDIKNEIIKLSDIIGKFDIQSQKNAILSTIHILETQLEVKRDKMKNFLPLCKTLTICASLVVFMLLI